MSDDILLPHGQEPQRPPPEFEPILAELEMLRTQGRLAEQRAAEANFSMSQMQNHMNNLQAQLHSERLINSQGGHHPPHGSPAAQPQPPAAVPPAPQAPVLAGQETSSLDYRLISSLKLADVAAFTGAKDGSVATFLNDVESRLRLMEIVANGRPTHDLIKNHLLVSRLNSSAKAWWDAQSRNRPLERWSFAELTTALRSEFALVHEELTRRIEYVMTAKTAIDKGAQGVQKYTDALIMAATKCDPQVDEFTKIVDYYLAMPHYMQRDIRLQFPAVLTQWTFERLTAYCTTYAHRSVPLAGPANSGPQPMDIGAIASTSTQQQPPYAPAPASMELPTYAPPQASINFAAAAPTMVNSIRVGPYIFPPSRDEPWKKLDDPMREALMSVKGCLYCREPYAKHSASNCPKKNNPARRKAEGIKQGKGKP